MINKSIGICFLGIVMFLSSCGETGNEPNQDTNTHNTSQPSAAVNEGEIKIDARSMVPANRLNDGNFETRSSNRSNVPLRLTEGVDRGAGTQEQQGDVQDNQQEEQRDQSMGNQDAGGESIQDQ